MAREFNVGTGGATVGATTLIFLNPPAAPNFNIEILRWWIGQAANATSAQQRVQIVSQNTSFPTLVANTPRKQKQADPNVSVLVGSTNGFPATAGVTASAEGAGTKAILWDDAFNVLNGWLQVPTPPETFIFPAGSTSGIGLFFPIAPGTTTTWSLGAVYREV